LSGHTPLGCCARRILWQPPTSSLHFVLLDRMYALQQWRMRVVQKNVEGMGCQVGQVAASDEESVGWVYSLEAGRGIDIMVGSM